MDEQFLRDQIDWVQARIEEMDTLVINTNPADKGSKELLDCYNKLVDRYGELTDELKHLNDVDIEEARLELEQDKINLDEERLRLDREKFAYEVEHGKDRELIGDIFEAIELTSKIAVPVLSLTAVVYVANLAYMNDSKLELCNGRVIGGVKDLLKIMTMRV